jgi:hypothetical protein
MIDPTTLDLIIKIVSASATLAIGAAASFLAYQQFRLSRSKLRFDLYEKRLAVFKTVRDFASLIAIHGEADAGAFYRDTIERRFLFEEDVYLYIEDMFKRAQELKSLKEQNAEPNLPEDERTRLKKAIVNHSSWFFDQTDEMFEVFNKDLAIRTLRYRKEKKPRTRKEKGRLNTKEKGRLNARN